MRPAGRAPQRECGGDWRLPSWRWEPSSSSTAVTGLTGPGYAAGRSRRVPASSSASALMLVGAGLLAQSLRGHWRVAWVAQVARAASQGSALCRSAMCCSSLLALALDVVLIAPLGFVVASAVLFACVSAAFGSRRFVLDAAHRPRLRRRDLRRSSCTGLGLHLPAGERLGELPVEALSAPAPRFCHRAHAASICCGRWSA